MISKLRILCLLFFLISSSLFAHDYWDDYYTHFYMEAGLIYPTLQNGDDVIFDFEAQEGWRFGLGFQSNEGKFFSWEIGAGLSKKRFTSSTFDLQGIETTSDTEIYSWDIPLIFHPQIKFGRYFSIAADIGIGYENRYKGSTLTNTNGVLTQEDLRLVKKENEEPNPGLKKHDAYAIVGASIRLRNLKLSAQHNFGIVDMDANKHYRTYMQTTMFKITGLF